MIFEPLSPHPVLKYLRLHKNRRGRPRIYPPNHCLDCGKLISRRSKRCHKCAGINLYYKEETSTAIILGLINEHPVREVDLARQLGISRERVRQIRNKFQLCQFISPKKPPRLCGRCGKKTHPGNKSGLCQKCLTLTHRTVKVCEVCGKEFSRPPSHFHPRAPGRFCSRHCHGVWLGKTYGVGSPNETERQRQESGRFGNMDPQLRQALARLGGLAKAQKALSSLAKHVPGP